MIRIPVLTAAGAFPGVQRGPQLSARATDVMLRLVVDLAILGHQSLLFWCFASRVVYQDQNGADDGWALNIVFETDRGLGSATMRYRPPYACYNVAPARPVPPHLANGIRESMYWHTGVTEPVAATPPR